jgi:hypothetical protein
LSHEALKSHKVRGGTTTDEIVINGAHDEISHKATMRNLATMMNPYAAE